CGMERGFLSQKGSGVGRGVKEKDLNVVNRKRVKDGAIPPITVVGDTSTILEVTTSAGNALGKSLYANITGKPGGKKVNVRTLFTSGGNGIDVVNPVDSIRTISERFTNKAYGFFLRKKVACPVVANYRGFLCSGKRWRGIKEKDKHGTATGSVMESDGIVNDATPLVDSVVKEVGSPYVVDETVAKEKQSSLVNTTGLGSYPPLPTQETTSAGNALGKSSYANVTGKPSEKKLNIRTLFTPRGNGIDVVVPIVSLRSISRSSYARVMIELRADVELKDNIVVVMPRIKGQLDNDGNLLVATGIMESNSEVEVVFNETANLRISKSGKDRSDKGYGINSLLEQWSDSYPDNDDYDPYDDNMYEDHDLSEHLQSICDDLDITIRRRKKK
nr:hypothetical protein [Tanacetum cinerariifolium]